MSADRTVDTTAEPEGRDQPQAPAPGDDEHIRVVVVDDAEDLRVLIRHVLELDGRFDVVGEAATGVEAIEVAAREQPDLVLLDLSMPDMDGLEALPTVLSVVPGTCVVVLSGFSSDAMANRAVLLGASGYLEKGIAAHEMPERLVGLVDRSRRLGVTPRAGDGPSSRP